jgi:hypothetical protein|nr:MAG TPA: hypothetical protein [Caudoviricetes sp.]
MFKIKKSPDRYQQSEDKSVLKHIFAKLLYHIHSIFAILIFKKGVY